MGVDFISQAVAGDITKLDLEPSAEEEETLVPLGCPGYRKRLVIFSLS